MKNHNPHILKGSISKGVLSLSAPIVFAMFFHSLLNIVDTFWVGKISAVAVAAVSISWPVIFILIALSAGISTGTNSLVARFVGANDMDKASDVAKNSIFLGLMLAILLSVTGLMLLKPLFIFLGASGELLSLALDYSRIVFYGTVFHVMNFVLASILRGEGDTKTPMKIAITINVVNMILDPILILYLGLGVAGASLATLLSVALGVGLYFRFILSDKANVRLDFSKFGLDWKLIYDVLFIGFPASLRNITNAVGVFFTMKFITVYGAAAVAAYGIAFRVESFGVLPVVAISLATMTMVGQNLGAEQFKRAKRSGWVSAFLGAAVMAVFGILVFIFAPYIIKIFNSEKEVVRIGAEVLKIKSPAFLFSALIMSLSSAFQAFGKSHYSFIITIFRVALMLALIYWFNSLYGLVGIWWGIVLSGILSGIVNVVWYKLYSPKKALKTS